MQYYEEKIEDTIILKPLVKRIDASNAQELKTVILERTVTGNVRILIDLSFVDFIDSSGLGAVVSVLKASGRSSSISICGLSETVNTVFRLSRMDKIFQIFDSKEQALKALHINR